jgi:hypothetical protein
VTSLVALTVCRFDSPLVGEQDSGPQTPNMAEFPGMAQVLAVCHKGEHYAFYFHDMERFSETSSQLRASELLHANAR